MAAVYNIISSFLSYWLLIHEAGINFNLDKWVYYY